jgi:thioredoxin-dependent peroxiredoxin
MPNAHTIIAPSFSLKDKNGILHSLQGMDSKYLVLYFYPCDSTPGCTIEAREFTKLRVDFEAIGASIVGISGGDEHTKNLFASRFNLNILLLSDPDFNVSKSYGVFGKKTFLGKSYEGIQRTTFILNRKKQVLRAFSLVNPLGHGKEILNTLKTIDG